jgi:uncharacterized protein
MAFEYKRIDVDSHCQEKPDTWTSRMSKEKWGDRIPRIREVDGKEVWWADGKLLGPDQLAACHGLMPDRITLPTRWVDVPSMIYTADGRMRAMDTDGVSAQVLFANTAGPAGGVFLGMESELERDCLRAYNDYLSEEFYDVAPHRFIPLAQVPLRNVEFAVAEMEHTSKRGHKGFVMISAPEQYGLPAFADRHWDPLWAAAQELGMAAHFHARAGANRLRFGAEPGANLSKHLAIITCNSSSLQAQLFSTFLLSGVLERFPKLTFVGAESGIGWVPYVLEACDYEWERGKLYKSGLPRRPSDMFRQQCYVDFWYEQAGLKMRDYIGVDRILWETDFPHPTSIFPEADKWLKWSFEGVPEADQHKILVENPMRLYHLQA